MKIKRSFLQKWLRSRQKDINLINPLFTFLIQLEKWLWKRSTNSTRQSSRVSSRSRHFADFAQTDPQITRRSEGTTVAKKRLHRFQQLWAVEELYVKDKKIIPRWCDESEISPGSETKRSNRRACFMKAEVWSLKGVGFLPGWIMVCAFWNFDAAAFNLCFLSFILTYNSGSNLTRLSIWEL